MGTHSDQNDKTLVELTLLGDEKAYEELVLRHQRAVMGTAFKVTKNKYLAEDASQDAFVLAWMNLSELREGEKFGSWICSFAKNCARTLERHYRVTIPDISLDAIDYYGASESEEEPFFEDCCEDLHSAVESLSAALRETMKLHYFEGKSVADIAKALSVSVGTVKWRLSEGRKQLRKGYGIMEKRYDENESLLSRVRHQVETLKLWRLKGGKRGFEDDYRAVMANLELLKPSKEKNSLLADTLLQGYWWLPGKKNDEVFAQVKKAAEEGHNDDVMGAVAAREYERYSGDERVSFMRETQIPYYRLNGYTTTLAHIIFWLGYEYRKRGEYEEAINCYEQVMEILSPSDVYFANAKAAIEGERLSLAASKRSSVKKFQPEVTGAVYKRIGNRLYFWEQPGYGKTDLMADGCLFYNMSRCDRILYDEKMLPGEAMTSFDGKMTLTYKTADGICDTPAGHFENCSVYVCRENYPGLTYVETWLCNGIGVVRQIVTSACETNEWVLSEYKLSGCDGFLPFAAGDRLEYVLVTPDDACKVERKNVFEVTACDGDSVTVASMAFAALTGYSDTWKGKMLEARNEYSGSVSNNEDRLCDVSDVIKRAEELAVTKRQKLHTAVANDVMRRIFKTDPVLNPDYTEKGRWNFFEYDVIRRDGKKVSYIDDRRYSFECKDMANCGCEGYKVLYSFFLAILNNAAGCVWSDEWRDGYHFDERKIGRQITKNFTVTGGEKVETPAGTFDNCLRVSFDYGGEGYFSGRSDYLFAEGVGVVKFEHPFDENKCAEWELVEYKGTGEGLFPTDDGLFRRYEATGLGAGWHGSVEYTFDKDETGTVMLKNALGTQDREEYEKEPNDPASCNV